MSHIWTFSEESKELLQRCLDAAAPTDGSNKWIRQFGWTNDNKADITVIIDDSPEIDEVIPQIEQEEQISSAVEEFTDPDFDIISKLNILEEKSAGSSNLKELAFNLPINTIEKINLHVFNNKNINDKFLKRYFKYILPIYVKRDNSRLSTDLMLKTYKLYPDYFKILLKVILKDLEIQNNIINDFILSLNSIEQAEFLNNMINIEFNEKEFSHNLFNINTAYKNCNKTDSIQKHVFSLLKTHSQFCTTDKNYGKLLLAYLQYEKSLNKELSSDIEQIIEMHNSPFKRPCIAILKEINIS